MRTVRKVTIAGVAAVAIGLNALVPTAFAQNAPTPPAAPNAPAPQAPGAPGTPGGHGMMPGQHSGGRMMMRGMRPGMGQFMANRMNRGGGDFLQIGCGPNVAEALDVGLVHLSYRLGLTDAQKPAFDKLHTDALAAQASYAESCKTLLPQRGGNANGAPAGAAPDPIQRLADRLKLDQARIDAMNKVLPDLQALYASLTDDQKAKLQPPRMMQRQGLRPGMNWNQPGKHSGKHGNRPGADNTAAPANPSSV